MKISSASILLSFVIFTSSFKTENAHLATASELRRGSRKQNDDIQEMPSSSAYESNSSSETRSLVSLSTLTEAEIFAMKKTPPPGFLHSSKCGTSLFRKKHPRCYQPEEEKDETAKPPSIPLFAPPTVFPPGSLALSPPPATTSPPTATTSSQPSTPSPTMSPSTPMPSANPTQPLNCVQDIVGNELTIPVQKFFMRGELLCFRLDTGQQAYFGYNTFNQFGLFVNGQAVWTVPESSVAASDRWMFQNDGNLLLRNSRNVGIWRTHTSGNWNSIMRVSSERVWIESSTGTTLWFQPEQGPPTTPPVFVPTSPPVFVPTSTPTRLQDRPLNCEQKVEGNDLSIPRDVYYRQGDVHCLKLEDGEEVYFGYTWSNKFGLFLNEESVWTVPDFIVADFDQWMFQEDGNLVLRNADNNSIWTSRSHNKGGIRLKISKDRVWIETGSGYALWSQPSFLGQPSPPSDYDYPDPNGALQYYAYYYPWYLRNNWSRHGYQDEPLLGKYGTNEVAVAEQHIQWALETGITSWVISWWGPNHLAMKHFKAGMMNAPSLNKMKFCMLYESVILKGSWRNGSNEEAMYQHLKVIRDEFFDHPSYLKINGRPVVIFYITRSRMMWQEGFDGPAVLANMRRRLGRDIYFIADEPFFNSYNRSPDGNQNAFKNGKQVFDAYTTYNMFVDSKVRRGETATAYQLREGLPIWKRWAEKVPFFPNVMPQYYDFRGHKPLLGNAADFKIQLREVACLRRTNFNGAPHIMFITSFNEWWEGTQIEPEDGSPGNWNNYGFQFMETLAEFKREVDSAGTYWCD